MAWQQVFLPSTVFSGYQGTLVNFDVCEETLENRSSDSENITFINQYLTGDMIESGTLSTTETEIYRKDNYYLTIKRESGSGPGYFVYYKFYSPSTSFTLTAGSGNGSHRTFYKVALAIDKDNQKGAFVQGILSESNYYCTVGRILSNGQEAETQTKLYNWLIGAVPNKMSNGGGATHIAKVTGQLSALSSSISDILIVSGGGGGGMIYNSTSYAGADAGGISGSGSNSGNQSTGYAFGLGEAGTNLPGGGAGFYGGYKGVT